MSWVQIPLPIIKIKGVRTLALKKYSSSSPGQRHQIRVNRKWKILQGDELLLAKKGPSIRKLMKGLTGTGGRNTAGRITAPSRGSGNFKKYRILDWKRSLWHIPAIVQRLEYDPNRSAFIALLVYNNGLISYQLATHNVQVGDTLMSGPNAPLKVGNTLPLYAIPVGTTISCIETIPGKGITLCRSAGAKGQLIRKNWSNEESKERGYALILLQSGIYKAVPLLSMATIGQVSNLDHQNEILGKAGRSRWKGIRPRVRGTAKNAVDHPHGGGRGKTSGGRPSVTPKGRPTKGRPTRHRAENRFHRTVYNG